MPERCYDRSDIDNVPHRSLIPVWLVEGERKCGDSSRTCRCEEGSLYRGESWLMDEDVTLAISSESLIEQLWGGSCTIYKEDAHGKVEKTRLR